MEGTTQPSPEGANMQRDMDTVRKILLATADMEYGQQLKGVEGVTPEDFIAHAIWLTEAGLIEAAARAGTGSMAKYAIVSRLTWSGCDFVDAIRNDTLWSKAKERVMKPGMSFTFDVVKDWLKTEITQGLPTIRALGQ